MLDSIYIAMTGLHGYEEGLRVISNNTTNMNTPGFKGATLQFSDLFYSNGGLGGRSGGMPPASWASGSTPSGRC